MREKKVTVMILKVDLQCDRCYTKVKKVLCKFPEIRDRIFDEKSNTVTIKVISCDPEKIRCRLCRKGRGCIKSIEIKELEEPKPAAKPPADPPKPKEETPPPPPPAAKPESPKKPPPAPAPEPVQKQPEPQQKPEPAPKAPEPVQELPKPTPKSPEPAHQPAPKAPEPAPKPVEPEPVKPVQLFGSDPIPTCCEQCYCGRAGGPCNYGYGAPPVYYEGYYYGRIGFNGHGPNRYCHPGRCADYFSEENPAGCSIM